MKIKSIKKSGIKPTWDIEVNDVHEYLLENGCVSHNTASILGNEASSAATKYSVRIFDEAGKVVKTETIIPGESNTVFINIASLAAGIYYAEVNADGIVTGLKFVKQ